MSLLAIVILLVIVGVILYVVNNHAPWIDPKIKKILNIFIVTAVILFLLVFLLRLLGVWGEIRDFRF